MKSERILELIARKLGRAAGPDELQELEALLVQHPEYRYVEEVIHAIGGNRQHIETPVEEQDIMLTGWEQLSSKLEEGVPEVKRRKFPLKSAWLAAAAVLLVLLAGGGWLWKKQHTGGRAAGEEVVKYEIVAGNGTLKKAVLPDGTQIWLNAGSKLTYTNDFMGLAREVKLEGEAFFDVTRNHTKPFIVYTDHLTVRVLGTAFNVKAYKGDRNAETTVIDGKVQVIMGNNPDRKVILSKQEKLIMPLEAVPTNHQQEMRPVNALKYQVQELPINRQDSSLVMETAWLNQKLAFVNETFEEVAHKMERQFDVHIHFENEALKYEVLAGVFEKEGVDKALRLLQMTTGFRYRIEKKEIYLFK
ncbi:FecR family protein [Chitinophaga defluvii]|uniref:FecR family protein n=1 Tax=Chitinophaga defluvii TaxID=3163343 RepID=A0ABV2T4U1_9BACT